MKFKTEINVMPLKSLLDPQGKTVGASMKNIGLDQINNVRIGKHITLELEAENKKQAIKIVNDVCEKIVCNQIMESFDFVVSDM